MYNDTSYKLPGPAAESTDLMTADPAASGLATGGGGGGPDGAGPVESRSPREWLLLVVWRQKWLVLAALAVALIGAAIYLILATPVYSSTAKIYVAPQTPVLGAGQAGAQNNGGTNFLATQKELITSEPVLKIAGAKLRDAEKQDNKPIVALRGAGEPEAVLKDIVSADLDKNNDIISVVAYSPHPDEAEAIANAMIDAYMAYQTKPKVSTTPETLKVLEAKKKEAEDKLQTANESLRGLEAQFGPLDHKDERTNIVIKHLQGLSEAWTQARRETIDARSEFEDAARSLGITEEQLLKLNPTGSEDDLPGGTSPAEKALYRSAILQAQAVLQDLGERYLPNHPYVMAQKKKVEGLRRTYLGLIRRVYIAAMRKEREFQESYNEEQKNAITVNAKAAEYARVQEEVDKLKKERDEYAQSIRGIEIGIKTGGITIDVVEKARAETRPSIPNPKRVLPIAAAVGLVLGLMLACMREWIDDRFHNAGDMKTSLGIPLLAVIPQSTTKRSPSVSGQRILLDPASDAAEAYRSLRTALQFAAPDGQMRTLLVTSPTAGDGKTTLASNLAIAMAQAGKKVCLVDCDLRKPMQHEIFSAKSNTGLSMLLAGRCSLETATQRTGVTGLELLPCGPAPANPGEILNSREFGDTLEQLAEKYDCVVIDAPPVEAGNDARVIAALSDATLLVLKAQTAHRRSAERARDSLLGVGARLIGMVVNDVPRRTQTAYGQLAATRRYVPGLTSQEYDILQARTK